MAGHDCSGVDEGVTMKAESMQERHRVSSSMRTACSGTPGGWRGRYRGAVQCIPDAVPRSPRDAGSCRAGSGTSGTVSRPAAFQRAWFRPARRVRLEHIRMPGRVAWLPRSKNGARAGWNAWRAGALCDLFASVAVPADRGPQADICIAVKSGGQDQFSILCHSQPVFAALMVDHQFAASAEQFLAADLAWLGRSPCSGLDGW